MRGTLKKINIFVEEVIRKELDELVPDGQKNKVINEALRKELLRIKREKATGKLMALKSKREEWGHTLISDYFIDNKRQFCYLVCHDKTMAHRI